MTAEVEGRSVKDERWEAMKGMKEKRRKKDGRKVRKE